MIAVKVLSTSAQIMRTGEMKMPEQIENRTVVDSEWEGVESLQMRIPNRSCRRMQRIIDEMEYGRMEEEE